MSQKGYDNWELIREITQQATLLKSPRQEGPYVGMYVPLSYERENSDQLVVDRFMRSVKNAPLVKPPEVIKPTSAFVDTETFKHLPNRREAWETARDNFLTYWNGRLYQADRGPLRVANMVHEYTPEAYDYWEDVRKLDATPAGTKSRRLLAHLIETYIGPKKALRFLTHGYFDVDFANYKLAHEVWKFPNVRRRHDVVALVKHNKDIGWPFEVSLPTVTVRFQQWPQVATYLLRERRKDGSLKRWYRRDPRFKGKLVTNASYSLCLHPAEPYPSADLLAAQFMFTISSGVGALLDRANW